MLHQASSSLKLPTDLAGVVTAAYDRPRADGNRRAAVGAACDNIRQAVRDLGVVDSKAAEERSGRHPVAPDAHGEELSRQGADIRRWQVALQGIVDEQYELESWSDQR